MRNFAKTLVLVAATAHLAATPLLYATPSYALAGNVTLPEPYVSRAFDAVLLPINATVRDVFGLNPTDEGVLVLATEPGGVADSQGILPGDVIYEVRGHKIVNPIDLDEVVYYWISLGDYDFAFDYYRDGVLASAAALITLELYDAVIDISSVSSWSAWSVETSFSYAEFYEEYSATLTESYETSQTTIEETVSSDEFISEVTSDDEAVSEDSDGDGIDDADDTDDDGDGVDDAEDTDDDGDGIDDSDEVDDSSEDDGGADDAADDGGEDDGGADGGDEE